ncbi:MAG TPA: hypothetical protein PLQ97_13240 [Myxococcota bacterium]|nr:hypothetical protein [Myxococcota bacterium]HQK52173.1 hypothetical protein [Myxococcota bacterium]
MDCVAISVIGDLVVLHPDNPPEAVVRSRLALLLQAPLPRRGWVRILPGSGPDEMRWQALASEAGPIEENGLLTGFPKFPVART